MLIDGISGYCVDWKNLIAFLHYLKVVVYIVSVRRKSPFRVRQKTPILVKEK